MASWCVILLGVVVVALTGTNALEAGVGIVAPLRPLESASWHLIDEVSKRKKQNKQNNGESHAQGDGLAKAQRQSADLQRKLQEGKQKRRTTSQKSPSGPKGCPNGCGRSRCQQVSLQRHHLRKTLLQPQRVVSFISVLMHREPCRIQLINSWLRCSLRWQTPPSRKKCFWLVGSSSWTSRSRKRSVRWIRWRRYAERSVPIHSASSNVASEHKQTSARHQNGTGPVISRAFRCG